MKVTRFLQSEEESVGAGAAETKEAKRATAAAMVKVFMLN